MKIMFLSFNKFNRELTKSVQAIKSTIRPHIINIILNLKLKSRKIRTFELIGIKSCKLKYFLSIKRGK